MSYVRILTAVVVSITAHSAHAGEFVHNFDMHGDYLQHLYSATNAFVLSEGQPGNPTMYWSPTQANIWGEVIHKYDLEFVITEASFFANILAISSGAQTFLDVSPDGQEWTTVASGYVHPPLAPIDLTSILAGSNTAFIRARLWSDFVGSVSYAQFLRTYQDSLFAAPGVYEFRAVPEPNLGAIAIGLYFCISRYRTRHRDAREAAKYGH